MPAKKKALKRVKLKNKKSLYFSNENSSIQFVTSGCQLFDNVLGGGWAMARMINLVGDKSSGKTLLAIEACANFHKTFPDSRLHYIEVESAFDKPYAAALGMPVESVIFQEEMDTVEDVFTYLTKLIATKKSEKDNSPELVVIDSMDALSDAAEKDREIDKGSYGANKAKQLSEIFRRLNKDLSKVGITLFIISQIRDKMNVMFGKKTQRAGGRALDFYASQVVWLTEKGKIKKTRRKIERKIGVNVVAKCEKNKVGLPYRECAFPIIFGYGVDDLTAGMDWLKSIGKLKEMGLSEKEYKEHINNLTANEEHVFRKKLNKILSVLWKEVEIDFLPRRKKY